MNGSQWFADHETHTELRYVTDDYVPQNIMTRNDFTDEELDKVINAVTHTGSFSRMFLGKMLIHLIKYRETGNHEYFNIARDYLGVLAGSKWGE